MTPTNKRTTLKKSIISSILFALLWLSFLNFPAPKIINLDTSWQQAFAHFFKHAWQAGVDYIFTYGPLGYLSLKEPSYDPELFYTSVIWWSLASLLTSLVFLARAWQIHYRLEKFLYLFLLTVIVSEVARFSDSFYFLGMVSVTGLLLHPFQTKKYWATLGLALLSFAILSLTKFTFFIFSGVCTVAIATVLWQQYSWRIAAATCLSFTFLFIGIWLLCQQSLVNLPTFLSHSWQITSFYSETMSVPLDLKSLELASYIAFLVTFMILLSCFPWQLTKVVNGSLLLLALFFNWKASFVRYEELIHGVMFFCFTMMVPFLIIPPTQLRPIFFRSLLLTNTFIALFGIFYIVNSQGYTPTSFLPIWANKIVNNVTTLTSLTHLKSHYEQLIQQELASTYQLPKVQATVGYATVDMFPPQQSIIFLNHLNYHPRPVFQGYAAYTEELLKLNGDFYSQATAPQFILFNLRPLDNHFPTLEDSPVLQTILRDYQPLFWEKDFLLLKHHPRHEVIVKPIFTKTVPIGEKIDLTTLSNQKLYLSIDIQKSFLGKLRTFLLQLPPIWLEVASTTQAKWTYRLLPSISNTSFFINPLLLESSDWLQWYLGQPQQQLASLRIVTPNAYLFKPTVTVTVSESNLTPYPLEDSQRQVLWETFFASAQFTTPDEVSGPYYLTDEKPPRLMMPSPGEIRFKVIPGTYKFSGQFGHYSPAGQVEFRAVFVDQYGQASNIFQKILHASDNQATDFDFHFTLQAAGHVVLRTYATSSVGKGAFWSKVQLVHED